MQFIVKQEQHIHIRPDLCHVFSITKEYMVSLACAIEDYMENKYDWNVNAKYDGNEFCIIIKRQCFKLNRSNVYTSHVAYIRANELQRLSGKPAFDVPLIADAYHRASASH